jgi:hypothetical protein
MKPIKCEGIKVDKRNKTKKECLLRQVNSVSGSDSPSFERGELAWEASTLPLSYTRQNRIYFSPKIPGCKGWLYLGLTASCL